MTQSETSRQSIWALMKSEPEKVFSLAELQKRTTHKRSLLRAACRHLIRKGMASGSEVKEPRPTKKNPQAFIVTIAVQYLVPWSTKINKCPL